MSGFDQSGADRILGELARQILSDEEFAGKSWQAIALVIGVRPRRRMFGYLYRPDGSWEAAIPTAMRPTIEKARELAAAMRVDGQESWKACLLQFHNPGPRIKADFEYEDHSRWDISPANLEQRVEEIRPRTDT
ncbi:hypothetical protein N8D56_18780 [Devosia sp. A8/3-2]|nr:hypothetical protein N8D56_18780 [Devosia sp. A8/3-2]